VAVFSLSGLAGRHLSKDKRCYWFCSCWSCVLQFGYPSYAQRSANGIGVLKADIYGTVYFHQAFMHY